VTTKVPQATLGFTPSFEKSILGGDEEDLLEIERVDTARASLSQI
jgi:hypothetical protein